jgi:hypothetical protein
MFKSCLFGRYRHDKIYLLVRLDTTKLERAEILSIWIIRQTALLHCKQQSEEFRYRHGLAVKFNYRQGFFRQNPI